MIKIVDGVYPHIPPTETGTSLDYWTNVNFIWDSPGKM